MPSAKNDLQNTIRIARHYRRTSPFEKGSCSHGTAICTDWVAKLYLYSTSTLPLLYHYSTSAYTSTSPPANSSLLYACSTLLLLFSTILDYSRLYSSASTSNSTSPLLYSSLPLLYLYSTSTPPPPPPLPLPLPLLLPLPLPLPLLDLYSTLPYSSLLYSTLLYPTSTLPLLYVYAGRLDTMTCGLVRMWLHGLWRHTATGHNDLWASENVKVRNSEFPPWNFLWK